MNKRFTVAGVFADAHDERFALHVMAEDEEDAEAKSLQHVEDRQFVVAGVFDGWITLAKTKKVAHLSQVRRGYEAIVARVTVNFEKRRIPFKCPECRADLTKEGAVEQWDYHPRTWAARVPKKPLTSGHGVLVDTERGTQAPGDGSGNVAAAALLCGRCHHELWNGYKEVHG